MPLILPSYSMLYTLNKKSKKMIIHFIKHYNNSLFCCIWSIKDNSIQSSLLSLKATISARGLVGLKGHLYVTLSELVYRLFWHNFSVLEVTYYAQNNASIMWKSLVAQTSLTNLVDYTLMYGVLWFLMTSAVACAYSMWKAYIHDCRLFHIMLALFRA